MSMKQKNKRSQAWYWAYLLYLSMPLAGMDIGSDTAVTRFNTQVTINDGDRVAGFAALDGGFSINGSNATGTFDSFFQVSGPLAFNAGTLILSQDLKVANISNIGPLGNIVGNFHTLDLGYTITVLPDISDVDNCELFFVDDAVASGNIETVAFAFDSTYIAAGNDGGVSDIFVYAFNDPTLTLVDTESPPGAAREINVLRWHPSAYFLAMGREAGTDDELFIYSFDTGSQTLTQVDSVGLGGSVQAIAWHPDGDFIVIGTDINGSEIIMYPINGSGILGAPVTINITPDRDVQEESMDFDTAGDYFAVGLNTNAANPTVLVYEFTKIPLGAVLNASAISANTVAGLSWNQADVDIIAVGQLGTTGDRVIAYEHDAGGGTLTQVASISDYAVATGNVAWNPDGVCLAVGVGDSGAGGQIRSYVYDQDVPNFQVATVVDRPDDVESVSWAPNGGYVAFGEDATSITSVYRVSSFLQDCVNFSDIQINLSSNVDVYNTCILFSGLNVINGQGNILDLTATSSFIIDSNASLRFENICLRGLGQIGIHGVDTTSTVTLRDASVILDTDFTFTEGKLVIQADCELQGLDKEFKYQSDGVSTIDSFSRFVINRGTTFSYEPTISSQALLQFADTTSQFVLNGGTLHATTVGLNLTGGTFSVDRASFLTSDATTTLQAITFGDNSSSSSNIDLKIAPAASLQVSSGIFVWANV